MWLFFSEVALTPPKNKERAHSQAACRVHALLVHNGGYRYFRGSCEWNHDSSALPARRRRSQGPGTTVLREASAQCHQASALLAGETTAVPGPGYDRTSRSIGTMPPSVRAACRRDAGGPSARCRNRRPQATAGLCDIQHSRCFVLGLKARPTCHSGKQPVSSDASRCFSLCPSTPLPRCPCHPACPG